MSKKNFWKRGQMAVLSRAAGIRTTALSDILHRRRGVGKDLALKLEFQARKVLRRKITACAWVFNETTRHPAFFGKPLHNQKRK